VHALRNLNLSIAAGEYVAVMGPSGSGKSTLLNLLGLLDRPNTGLPTGRARCHDAVARRAGPGAQPAYWFCVPEFSPGAAPDGCRKHRFAHGAGRSGPGPARESRVKQALKDYGLENRADHRPDELSGGQRQRVAIARATIMQPAMILADEPTGNLDRSTGEEVVRLLEGLNASGVTLIMVTHDASMGARARRQLLMEDGAVKQDHAQH
jgi:putative ABC transport system ATP-binding protein